MLDRARRWIRKWGCRGIGCLLLVYFEATVLGKEKCCVSLVFCWEGRCLCRANCSKQTTFLCDASCICTAGADRVFICRRPCSFAWFATHRRIHEAQNGRLSVKDEKIRPRLNAAMFSNFCLLEMGYFWGLMKEWVHCLLNLMTVSVKNHWWSNWAEDWQSYSTFPLS